MKEIHLTIRKRAFPSQGRVRFSIAHLPDLGIKEGDRVDLVNEATKKSVTVTVMADTIVREGQVRVSEEDAKSIGLNEDDAVLIRKSPPAAEKIRKAADVVPSPAGDLNSSTENVKKRVRKVKSGTAAAAVPSGISAVLPPEKKAPVTTISKGKKAIKKGNSAA
jgi:formylmethanofuran dehydrogenase subunit D